MSPMLASLFMLDMGLPGHAFRPALGQASQKTQHPQFGEVELSTGGLE